MRLGSHPPHIPNTKSSSCFFNLWIFTKIRLIKDLKYSNWVGIFTIMQVLLKHIAERIHLDPALEERIVQDFVRVEATRGKLLLREGVRADYLYFIEKGVLDNFYYHDHKEVTSWFYIEGQFITAWYSFYNQTASFESIRCLEDCTLYSISYDAYQKLMADFPAFNTFARLMSEEILSTLDIFSKSWSFMSAKEKYSILHEYFPQIELRVKLGLIASFLGISQETLSRIRAGK